MLAILMAVAAAAPVAQARPGGPSALAAQDPTGPEDEAEGQEGQGGAGEGQGTAEAETGAGGQTEGGTSATGPPWTYQMARLALVLLAVLAGAIALAYYRFVAKRQRGEV